MNWFVTRKIISDYFFRRARTDGTEEEDGIQLLDNSAARHKMAIRPKKHHPDPRSRAHDTHEER